MQNMIRSVLAATLLQSASAFSPGALSPSSSARAVVSAPQLPRTPSPLLQEGGNPLAGIASAALKTGSEVGGSLFKSAQEFAGGLMEKKDSPPAAVAVVDGDDTAAVAETKEEDEGWTLDKVAALGVAGVISIAIAETVFWVLSFPTSELLYFVSTGEWIDLTSQEGQLKFLAFTAGWGAIGGVIAQYRTVLTAAAMTPWVDENIVKPYVKPLMDKMGKGEE